MDIELSPSSNHDSLHKDRHSGSGWIWNQQNLGGSRISNGNLSQADDDAPQNGLVNVSDAGLLGRRKTALRGTSTPIIKNHGLNYRNGSSLLALEPVKLHHMSSAAVDFTSMMNIAIPQQQIDIRRGINRAGGSKIEDKSSKVLASMHRQSVMRSTYNKIQLVFKTNLFKKNMISLLQRDKWEALSNNKQLFNAIGDNSAFFTQQKSEQTLHKKVLVSQQSYNGHNLKGFLKSGREFRSLSNSLVVQNSGRLLIQLIEKIPLISPFSRWLIIWDQLQLLVLAFFFITIPIHIAFRMTIVQLNSSGFHFFLVVFLMLDILVIFNTGLFQQGREIKNRIKIANDYINKGMESSHLLNIFIFLYIFQSVLIGFMGDLLSLGSLIVYISSQNMYRETQQFRFFMNITLLLFPIRQRQFNCVLRKIEIQYYFSPFISQIIRLANLLLMNIYIIHILACIWLFIGREQILNTSTNSPNWIRKFGIEEESWEIQYMTSFYFNAVTMVTVGYGDITPISHIERVLSIFTVLSACGVFVYSISEIGNIFQQMNEEKKILKSKMFVINNYMKKKRITSDLQYQIRHYLEYYWEEGLSGDTSIEQKIISQLSNNLKENLFIEANRLLVLESPFFRDNFTFATVLKIVQIVTEQRCTPDEFIYLSHDSDDASIYFIEKGSVNSSHVNSNHENSSSPLDVLLQGQFFGEMEFLTGSEREDSMQSAEFTTLIKIDRKRFLEILKESPQDYEKFCRIRDDIILNKQIESTFRLCRYCKKQSIVSAAHTESNCPLLHFIPNKEKLEDRFISPQQDQNRGINISREKQSKKFNSLQKIMQVQGELKQLQFNQAIIIRAYLNSVGIKQLDDEDHDQYDDKDTVEDEEDSDEGEVEQLDVIDQKKSKKIKTNLFRKKISLEQSFSSSSCSSSSEQSPELVENFVQSQNKQSELQDREDIRLHTLIEEDKTLIGSDLSQSILIDNEIPSKIPATTNSESESFIVEESPAEEKHAPIKIAKSCLIPQVRKQEGVEKLYGNTQKGLLQSQESPFFQLSSIKSIEIKDQQVSYITPRKISTKLEITSPIRVDFNELNIPLRGNVQTLEKEPEIRFDKVLIKRQNSKGDRKQSQKTTEQPVLYLNVTPTIHNTQPLSNGHLLSPPVLKSPMKRLIKSQTHVQFCQKVQKDEPKMQRNKSSSLIAMFKPSAATHSFNSNKNYKSSTSFRQIDQPSIMSTSCFRNRSEQMLRSIQKPVNILELSSPLKIQNYQLEQRRIITNPQQQLDGINAISSQIDILMSSFQRVQEQLSIRSVFMKTAVQQPQQIEETDRNDENSMLMFDRMRIFDFYFPHNNYDVVIAMTKAISSVKKKGFQYTIRRKLLGSIYNQSKSALLAQQNAGTAMNQNRQSQEYELNALASTNNLPVISNSGGGQNQPNQQLQQIDLSEIFQQNSLNRLKILRNKQNRSSTLAGSIISELTQQSPFSRGDQGQGGSEDKQFHKQLPVRSYSPAHQLLIPNYFGVNKNEDACKQDPPNTKQNSPKAQVVSSAKLIMSQPAAKSKFSVFRKASCSNEELDKDILCSIVDSSTHLDKKETNEK